MRILLFIAFAALQISTFAEAKVEALFVAPPSTPVTNNGTNREPVFVTNDSIVFISKNRNNHKDPQLYFKDLKSGKERRLTHQRGQLASPLIIQNGQHVIYSSSTDEDEESPFSLKGYLDRFPSSVKNDEFFHEPMAFQEVYRSRLDGTAIERLTEHPGFDGTPAYLNSKDRLYFSRWKSGQIRLYAKAVGRSDLAAWRVTKTQGHDLGLKISPKQDQFVWYRFSPDFKSSQLLISSLSFKNPQFLTLESGVSWSPAWHPNGQSVIYSARHANHKDFDLYEVAINGKCQRQITSYEGDEFLPAMSPDGKQILFTTTQKGGEQIHRLDYPGPLECTTEATD